MKVGFIGLGAMGLPMTKRVVGAGYKTYTTFHSRREPADELQAMGAEVVASPSDVAKETDVVTTILPADAELRETVVGSAGILKGFASGKVLVEMTCASPKRRTRSKMNDLAKRFDADCSDKILTMIVSFRYLLGWIVSAFRSREDLVLENLALRQQLLALHAKQPRRRLTAPHRLFWVALRTFWPGWLNPSAFSRALWSCVLPCGSYGVSPRAWFWSLPRTSDSS